MYRAWEFLRRRSKESPSLHSAPQQCFLCFSTVVDVVYASIPANDFSGMIASSSSSGTYPSPSTALALDATFDIDRIDSSSTLRYRPQHNAGLPDGPPSGSRVLVTFERSFRSKSHPCPRSQPSRISISAYDLHDEAIKWKVECFGNAQNLFWKT
jgi:hypothetical protein